MPCALHHSSCVIANYCLTNYTPCATRQAVKLKTTLPNQPCPQRLTEQAFTQDTEKL